MVNDKEGRLFVLRLGKVARGEEAHPTPLPELPEGSGPFGLGAGPAFFQDAAYFISHGRLVRRKIAADGSAGSLEILARDALDGTRVAVPVSATRFPGKLPATAAYVVQPPKEDSPLIAKLWIEGAETLTLTAEGNSTHSVGLVRTADGVMAVSVQARMAMTPVHARRIAFVSGKPVLSDDLVTWVGSGIQPLNELALVPDGKENLWGFLPQERSIREFGLARLDIGMTPDMETGTSWLLYPNGIDPAPVSAARVCGKPMMLHTAPESATPGAPHELVLVSARQDWASAEPFRLDDDRVIYFVSISETAFGTLVVWVTDRATRAVTLRCTSGRK
jgi:hypothetical protein